MKELIGKMTLKSSNLPRKITVNKVDLFDQTKIAHEFNSFFTNIGKNLASKIPNASTPFEYFVNKSDFVMETKPLSMNELKDAFYSLKSNKSPDDLKIARVTPIYKGEDSSDVSNYRPISVLPCFSKILESIMYNRLYKSLIQNNILCSKRSFNWPRCSTIRWTNNWIFWK